MTVKPFQALETLEQLKADYGGDAARRKMEMLEVLEDASLSSAGKVFRLHETLCFLRAYPDSSDVLGQVEKMLSGFARRKDLRRNRRELANSGVAGTAIHYAFFWITACWLSERWPDRIYIDWGDFEKKKELMEFLHLLVHFSETPALDHLNFSQREWIKRLKGPDETDAYFLIRRFKALPGNSFVRETLYDRLIIPMRLSPGENTPSRTNARYPASPVVFQARPLSKARPRLRREIPRCPVRVSAVPPREARRLVDLAREAMVTRSRDLDAFEYAYEKDVRLISCDQGIQFVCLGVIPERRLLLDAVYSFLTLKNGVPIGYVLTSSFFRSSEVAFNMFETFRGAGSGIVYSRALAMVRRLFGSDTFAVPPHQLGYNNLEALESGAWWFYYKLGFRPRDPGVRRLLRMELNMMKRRPRHRTDIKTLNDLSSENMYFSMGKKRKDVIGEIYLGDIGLLVSRTLAERFGADREKAVRTFSREAARRLGLRSRQGFSAGERLAWERWSPLIMAVPGIEKWSAEDMRLLVRVVRAKGGRRESEFVRLFNRHRRLQKALIELTQRAWE
ncbi:MAG: hypothetical protein PVJ42_01050 [bacterium]|jgi:hypothetical protein